MVTCELVFFFTLNKKSVELVKPQNMSFVFQFLLGSLTLGLIISNVIFVTRQLFMKVERELEKTIHRLQFT